MRTTLTKYECSLPNTVYFWYRNSRICFGKAHGPAHNKKLTNIASSQDSDQTGHYPSQTKVSTVHLLISHYRPASETLFEWRIRYSQPACCLEPLSACQRNAIWMAFRWWANGGPLRYAYCDPYVHHVDNQTDWMPRLIWIFAGIQVNSCSGCHALTQLWLSLCRRKLNRYKNCILAYAMQSFSRVRCSFFWLQGNIMDADIDRFEQCITNRTCLI